MADANGRQQPRGLGTCAGSLERRGHPEIRPCGHSMCQACGRRPWGDVAEPFSCPWRTERLQGEESGSDPQPRAVDGTDGEFPLAGTSAWPDSVCVCHRAQQRLLCAEHQTFSCAVCRGAQNRTSHLETPGEEVGVNSSQGIRRSTAGREKFQTPKPSSPACRDAATAELGPQAADGDPAGLEGDPPFSRIQTLMAWTILLLFLVAIGGLSATIFVFARASVKPDGPEPQASASPCCPEGWLGALGHCFYLSEEEGTWSTGQNYCTSHTASLAAHGSFQALNTLVRQTGSANHWLGLRREPGQPWRWVDGTAFNHQQEVPGAGRCAYLAAGALSSAGCHTARGWACRREPGSPTC
ncbi:uncharacterized protein LOC142024404 [Carettochelys insculpta]|uniref:uncharacterized protein LOC142024404 n=1 Tax=Carettochelys insculpta TaxID=44489 RepID=UPI003EB7E426